MKKLVLISFIPLLFLPTPIAWGAVSQIPFGKKATILLFVGSHCACTDPHRLLVQSLVQNYKTKEVRFFAIFSNKDETKELVDRFMRQTEWDFPWIIDRQGKIKKKYQAMLTPEAILLNSGGKIVYRGAIDDSVPNLGQVKNPYLKTALEQLLEGKPTIPQSTPPYGCYIVR